MSYHWNHERFTHDLLRLLPEGTIIEHQSPGGDYDVGTLVLRPPGMVNDCITVTPFVNADSAAHESFRRPGQMHADGVGIRGIEVRNQNSDSCGGCQARFRELYECYGLVLYYVNCVIDSHAVPHYDQLF